MALWGGLSFQNLISITNSYLDNLHDLVMVWLVNIFVIVLLVGGMIIFYKTPTSVNLNSVTLEITWTLIPILILITIAAPSITLLCLQDYHLTKPKATIKIVGNQWNWQSDLGLADSLIDHLLDTEKLDELSSYESPLFLPNGLVRFVLTSSDVLHSLGLPSLGVKLDLNPGRLNTTSVSVSASNLIVGSCYELCGSGHSAMPIVMLSG